MWLLEVVCLASPALRCLRAVDIAYWFLSNTTERAEARTRKSDSDELFLLSLRLLLPSGLYLLFFITWSIWKLFHRKPACVRPDFVLLAKTAPEHARLWSNRKSYDLEGYRFDAGLHYTIPWSGPLLRVAAGAAAPRVEFKKMGEPDGTFDKIVLGDSAPFFIKHHEAHLSELRKMFPSAEDQAAIDQYMTISEGLLKSTPVYILSKFLPLWMQKLIWKFFLKHFAKYSGQPALDVLRGISKNKKLVSLLCGLWIDTGTYTPCYYDFTTVK
jgi:hypothetical protein